MLMILLYTLSVIKNLVCDNNCSWLLNFNLTYKRHYGLHQELVC